MSLIVLKASKEFPSEIIGHRCDGCTEEILKTNPEDYNWFYYEGKDYCPECKDEKFPECLMCKERYPMSLGKEALCEDCYNGRIKNGRS